jgi:hypothetical protein
MKTQKEIALHKVIETFKEKKARGVYKSKQKILNPSLVESDLLILNSKVKQKLQV